MVQEEAASPWSVPGSLAEPELQEPPRPDPQDAGVGPAAPPGPDSGGRRGWNGRSRRSGAFSSAGPLADRVDDGATASVPTLALQPMTVADILDGAFAIIKARPARILGIAAVFVVPVHLLAAYLLRNSLGGESVFDAFNSDDPAVVADAAGSGGGGEIWALVLSVLVPALALVFIAAAIAHLVAAWTAGRDVTAGPLLRVVGRRSWPLLVSYVLVHVAEGVSALSYVGSIVIMALFSVTAPVIGAEGLGPLAAMKRSTNLTTRRFWPAIGVNLLIALVSTILGLALGGLPELLATVVGADVAWPLLAVGNIVGAVITTPFVAAATVLFYLDLRIRSEGLDIELATVDLAP